MSKIRKSVWKNIENSITSTITSIDKFFKKKKTIDNMYQNIIDEKVNNIHILQLKLKNINDKNRTLKNELLPIKKRIDKKSSLVKDIQALTSKKSI